MGLDPHLRVEVHRGAGVLLHLTPEVEVEPFEVLEVEAPVEARSHVGGDRSRFDRDRARTAEGIHEGLLGRPPGEHQERRGEVLLERRFAVLEPPAALEERLAGEVDVEAHVVEREVGLDPDVRAPAVHRGAAAGEFLEAVAEAVLDAQRREVEALERAAVRRRMDAEGRVRAEPLLPRGLLRDRVDVATVPVLVERDAHQYAGRQARMEAGGHAELEPARKRNAALGGADEVRVGVEREDLLFEKVLKTKGAGRVEDKARHDGMESGENGKTVILKGGAGRGRSSGSFRRAGIPAL